jgi:hypothetical protein
VIESDRTRDEQCLPYRYGAIQKRLARPHTLQNAAVVSQNRVEDPETAPGGEHAFSHDRANAGHLMTQSGFGQWGNRRRVYVSMREVPEKVPGGADPQPLQ